MKPGEGLEAAALYRAGWAPRVVLVREAPGGRSNILRALRNGHLSGMVLSCNR